MKRLLFIVVLCAPLAAYAGPASTIAWTPALLKFVKNGNAEKGKVLAETCKSCHGDNGEGLPAAEDDDDLATAIPALAGQLPNYTFKQLRDYAKGQRENPTMTAIAAGLSEQDTADLAVWFSTLTLPKASGSRENLAKAEKMVSLGDGKRILPPCFVCHGANGKGEKMDSPALAGQQADYFAKALIAYKSGERHNDIYSRMRLIAQQLSKDEIKELAQYYQALN